MHVSTTWERLMKPYVVLHSLKVVVHLVRVESNQTQRASTLLQESHALLLKETHKNQVGPGLNPVKFLISSWFSLRFQFHDSTTRLKMLLRKTAGLPHAIYTASGKIPEM